MAYQFPPDLDEQIKQQLATGRYDNVDDVIRDALEALKMSKELADFRASIAESQEQAAQGELGPLDVDVVMNRVKNRLSETN
jgi:putative addiction module CopG family antidote